MRECSLGFLERGSRSPLLSARATTAHLPLPVINSRMIYSLEPQESLELFCDGTNMESEEEAKQHSTVRSKDSKPLVISVELMDQPFPESASRLLCYGVPFSV